MAMIQLETPRVGAQAAAAATQSETLLAPKAETTAPVLGGENLTVTSAAMSDLEKLVARLKNENEATRQSVTQRRAAILGTVLDSMADRITDAERENILKIDALNLERSAAVASKSSLDLQQSVLESLIKSLDDQIAQAVKDGEEHREKVAELKRQRAEQQEKLDAVKESVKSVSSKIAGIDAAIEKCTQAIAASTLNEVYAALRAATVGEDELSAEAIETQADRARAEAKGAANDVALHLSAALDRLDGQIRAALDEAQMKVEG